MEFLAYSLLLISIILGVIGQLLLKQGMSNWPGFRIKEIWQLASDILVVGGFLSYGISVLLYFKVLETLDLSLAYPTVSLGYVTVILLSRIIFKESISHVRWIAVIAICTGVALVGLGA